MEIKQLSSRHIPQIKKLVEDSPAEKNIFIHPDEEEINHLFDNPHSNAYGVFDNCVLVGLGGYLTEYKGYSLKEGYFEISAVYIAKSYRHKGLGKLLLEKVLKELKEKEDYRKIFLTVSPQNISALLLYLNMGFVIFDFKKNYYGEGEDRLFMSL